MSFLPYLPTNTKARLLDTTTSNLATYTVTNTQSLILGLSLNGVRTVTLPASPFDNQIVIVTDESGLAFTNNITINANGKTFNDSSTTLQMDKNGGVVGLIFDLTVNTWRIWIKDYIKPVNPFEIIEVNASNPDLVINTTHLIDTTSPLILYLPAGLDGSFVGLQDLNSGGQPVTIVPLNNDKIIGDDSFIISGSYWTYQLIFYSGNWRIQ